MGENSEVRITYETLFDMLRTEKNKAELQKLPKTFLKDVQEYINEKRKIVSESKSGLFVAEEKERAEKQLINIRKILIELYEKREKKIVNMAIDKSRIKSDIVDTSALIKEEMALFEQLEAVFNAQRQAILLDTLTERPLEDIKEPVEKPAKKPAVPIFKETEEEPAEPAAEEQKAEKPFDGQRGEEETAKTEKLIRFIHAVPKFIGKELEIYGPFEEEDIAKLPSEIADVLIVKGRAEEIEQD